MIKLYASLITKKNISIKKNEIQKKNPQETSVKPIPNDATSIEKKTYFVWIDNPK